MPVRGGSSSAPAAWRRDNRAPARGCTSPAPWHIASAASDSSSNGGAGMARRFPSPPFGDPVNPGAGEAESNVHTGLLVTDNRSISNNNPEPARVDVDIRVTAVGIEPLRIGRQRQVALHGPSARTPVASQLTAVEKALLNYKDRPGGCVINPEIGITFDSYEEGFNYYNLYS